MEERKRYTNYAEGSACSGCGGPVTRQSRTGKCRACYYSQLRAESTVRRNYELGRTCSECGAPIPNKNKTGWCRACFKVKWTGPAHHGWKGGTINASGYRVVYGHRGHPNAQSRGEILEHVLVMSEILGRPLVKGETVHHRNGDRSDNRPENLELWSTKQPFGQRVTDKVKYAREILALYGEDVEEGKIT
jgi:HNH endonuclease